MQCGHTTVEKKIARERQAQPQQQSKCRPITSWMKATPSEGPSTRQQTLSGSQLSDGNERLSIAGATTATAAWKNSFKLATVVQRGKSEKPLQGEQFSQQQRKCSVCGPCSVDRQQSSKVEPAGACHTEQSPGHCEAGETVNFRFPSSGRCAPKDIEVRTPKQKKLSDFFLLK